MGPETAHSLELLAIFSSIDQPRWDEVAVALAPLKLHGSLTTWHEYSIGSQYVHTPEYFLHLQTSRVILVLLSPPFFESFYFNSQEMQQMIDLRHDPTITILPILLQAIDLDLHQTDFKHFSLLPRNGKPLMEWHNRASALFEIVQSVRQAIEKPLLPETVSGPLEILPPPTQSMPVSLVQEVPDSPSAPPAHTPLSPLSRIREQIIQDPIAGSKALSSYVEGHPFWKDRLPDIELKRAELTRLQQEAHLYNQHTENDAARNRAIYFLLELIVDMEEQDELL